MTPNLIPVFLNGRSLRAPAGTTLGQLLGEHEPALLVDLLGAQAVATDGRGLPVDPDRPLAAGAILRVFRSARHPGGADDA